MAAWIRALKAGSLIWSPSWRSMARRTLPSRAEVEELLGIREGGSVGEG